MEQKTETGYKNPVIISIRLDQGNVLMVGSAGDGGAFGTSLDNWEEEEI